MGKTWFNLTKRLIILLQLGLKRIHKVNFYPSDNNFTQALLVLLVTNMISAGLLLSGSLPSCSYFSFSSSSSHQCIAMWPGTCQSDSHSILLRLSGFASHHVCKDFFIGHPPRMLLWWWAGPPVCIWPTPPPLATLQLAADEIYQNGYFRQPAGLVWHNYKMRVVALKFIFEMTPLCGVVLLKLIFEPTVCRFKHFHS